MEISTKLVTLIPALSYIKTITRDPESGYDTLSLDPTSKVSLEGFLRLLGSFDVDIIEKSRQKIVISVPKRQPFEEYILERYVV